MRPTEHYHGVSESLQADVMRFMAIIAFCLIAILALVRGVEPNPVPATEAAEPAAPEPGAPEPAAPEPAAPRARPNPPAPTAPEYAVAAPALAISPPRPVARAVELPRPPNPEPPPESPPVRQPARPAPSASPDPVTPPSASRPDEGLSLRFASERDFLRLMNTGGVRVFAFRDGEVLSVSPDFRFEAVAAPGRLHELLPDTIPRLMTNALKTARGGADYHWGIAMPAAMSRQIRDYVERGVSGELVIDGRGEVHHEA